MAVRETQKDLEMGGRIWRVKHLDPQVASYVLYGLLLHSLPMGMEAALEGIAGKLPDARRKMSREDFLEFQRDCLSCCFEIVDGNPIRVMLPDGRWGVSGLEGNLTVVLALTVHAVLFNISCFFDGDALAEFGTVLGQVSLPSSASI